MRNVAILALFALATFTAWALSTALLVTPLLHVGQSYPRYVGLVTAPDAVAVLSYAVWSFFAAWLGGQLLAGMPFRVVLIAILVVFFLYTRGVFIAGNELSCGQLIILTAFITAVACAGMFATRRRSPENI